MNVTAGADKILERAEQDVDHGANMVRIDVLTAGFSALEELSRKSQCAGAHTPNHARRLHQRQRAWYCHAGHLQAGAHNGRNKSAYGKLHGQDGARNAGK